MKSMPAASRWLRRLAVIAAALLASGSFAQPVAIGGDAQRGGVLARQLCAGCHGADGNSTDPYFPKLSAQGAFYLYEQLRVFKQVSRRPSGGVMSAIAVDLDLAQMQDLAAWFSRQPMIAAAPPAEQRRGVRAADGERIWLRGIPDEKIPACASCHAVDGSGLPPEFPRLAGQHAQYLERQLREFRAGRRASNPNQMMRAIAHKMSDPEIALVASFIAQMR